MLALRCPGGEKSESSGGSGAVPKSAGRISFEKVCISRSGGPKHARTHRVPVSVPSYS